jgi:hypothetical protein
MQLSPYRINETRILLHMCICWCIKNIIYVDCLLFKYACCLRGPLMVAQWLKYYATNRKVAGSIPDGVIEIFH